MGGGVTAAAAAAAIGGVDGEVAAAKRVWFQLRRAVFIAGLPSALTLLAPVPPNHNKNKKQHKRLVFPFSKDEGRRGGGGGD